MVDRNFNRSMADQFRRYIAALKQYIFAGDERRSDPPGAVFIFTPTNEEEALASEGERLAAYMEGVGEPSSGLLTLCQVLRATGTLTSPFGVWFDKGLAVALARVAAAYDARALTAEHAAGEQGTGGRVGEDQQKATRTGTPHPKDSHGRTKKKFDKESAAILRVLNGAEELLDLAEISAGTGEYFDGVDISKKTCATRLKIMEAEGYVNRPAGERSGYALTSKGEELELLAEET